MQNADPKRAASSSNSLRAVSALLPFLRAHSSRIGAALILLACGRLMLVSVPLTLKEIVDALSVQGAILVVPVSLLLAYGMLRLAGSFFSELKDVIFAPAIFLPIRQISLQLLSHLLVRLGPRFHLEHRPGEITRDVWRGTQGVRVFLDFTVFNILPTLLEITLVGVLLLIKYRPVYALVTLATLVVYTLVTFRLTDWRMQFYRAMNNADAEANNRVHDALINHSSVKYYNRSEHELSRYDTAIQTWQDSAIRNQVSLSALSLAQNITVGVGVTILMFLAGSEVVSGSMTIGDLVLVNAFLIQLYVPLQYLGVVYREIQHSLSDMTKMFGLLDQAPEIQDHPDATTLRIGQGEILFEHVYFGYESRREVLADINIRVTSGQFVAVVGPSGGGKSTLAMLLLRSYDTSEGRVLVDGIDVRTVTQASLLGQIAFIPQYVRLFNDTIRYNIGYGRADASDAEIKEAARQACLEEVISRTLPDGYDTIVGEGGMKLSGGERQRVMIARAILKGAPIILMDEATSALDSETERKVFSNIRKLPTVRSRFVITHRLSSVVDADQILVVDQGRIIEQGLHATLLERQGLYWRMWLIQQKDENQSGEIETRGVPPEPVL